MKLDLKEFERGMSKAAGLGDFFSGVKNTVTNAVPGVSQLNEIQHGLKYLTGGGLMNDLGAAATKILPLALSLGGMGAKKAPAMPAPPKPLLGVPGSVTTFGGVSKQGNFLDMGMLRTILTARTANGIIDAAQGKNIPPAENTHEEDPRKIELVSKYPEINKMLADSQSRAYLESILTKDSHGA